MAVYVDPLRALKKEEKTKEWPWAHIASMWADTNAELLEMAAKLRLQPEWVIEDGGVPYFRMTWNKRERAVKEGAIEMGFKPDFIKKAVVARAAKAEMLARMDDEGPVPEFDGDAQALVKADLAAANAPRKKVKRTRTRKPKPEPAPTPEWVKAANEVLAANANAKQSAPAAGNASIVE